VSETIEPDDADPSRIVRSADVLGGKPRVAGRRIGVYFLHEQVEGRGLDAKTVAERHDLHVADVYHALAYYHEHPKEMARIRTRRAEIVAEGEADADVATCPEDLIELGSESLRDDPHSIKSNTFNTTR
jgi:uncharacterized protein (DUF433 family)